MENVRFVKEDYMGRLQKHSLAIVYRNQWLNSLTGFHNIMRIVPIALIAPSLQSDWAI